MLIDLLLGVACGWEKACGIKVAHATEGRAQLHADRLNARDDRRPQHAYPCIWCYHWHVGQDMRHRDTQYLIKRVQRRQYLEGRNGETRDT